MIFRPLLAETIAANNIWRVLLLEDHNTLIPVLGTALLGLAAGVIGTFAYLRRRAMMGDALSHATLPGIGLAFMLTGTKQVGVLIAGASVTGVLGVLAVLGIRQTRRIKEDAAIGIVLSVFFGLGMVLFSLIQQMATGQEAGLSGFIYGKAAGMITQDVQLIALASAVVLFGSVLLFREFRIVCFDQGFAAAQGCWVTTVDLLMMAMVVMVTVVGLQAVGLILVVALLIIPAAAARFWTDNLLWMVLIAGLIGCLSGWLGATASALAAHLPTGALIVMTAGTFFLISMLLAPHRGVLAYAIESQRMRRKVAYQNLLRALAEIVEQEEVTGKWIPVDKIASMRAWSLRRLKRTIGLAEQRDVLQSDVSGNVMLTSHGEDEAMRIMRNHRLWELFLIRYADIAPSHVDRDADEIEHVLSPEIVAELEEALSLSESESVQNPHFQKGLP